MKLFTIAQVHQVDFFTQISRQEEGWAWTQAKVAERDGTVETMYTMAAVIRPYHSNCEFFRLASHRHVRTMSVIEMFRQLAALRAGMDHAATVQSAREQAATTGHGL